MWRSPEPSPGSGGRPGLRATHAAWRRWWQPPKVSLGHPGDVHFGLLKPISFIPWLRNGQIWPKGPYPNQTKPKSAIFEDIDLKFCAHIYQSLPSNILYGFWKFWFWGENFWKRKKIVESFGNFRKFSKLSKSEIAVSYPHWFYVISYKKIDCSFKTAPVAAIPVNPYFRSKSVEHDVTLTSFVAELWHPGL